MSRAFVKEDVDPPERSGRVRSASGLPPGALNYTTAAGAARLRERLKQRRGEEVQNVEAIAELQRIIESLTVVEAPEKAPEGIAFGAQVTVRDATNDSRSYRIVGVNELDFYPDAVSWVSPLGRTLLAAERNRITLPDGELVTVERVAYPRQ